MAKLIFYSENHSYEVDGLKLPSVSEVIRFISRTSALRLELRFSIWAFRFGLSRLCLLLWLLKRRFRESKTAFWNVNLAMFGALGR